MAVQFSTKMEQLRVHRRAFEEALLRVERVARSSLGKETSSPRTWPINDPSWFQAKNAGGQMTGGDGGSESATLNPTSPMPRTPSNQQSPQNRSNQSSKVEDKSRSSKPAQQGASANKEYNPSAQKKPTNKEPSKELVSLPDPEEERTHETLIAARHALWQQSYMRIQSWLRSSEAITLDAEHNRSIHRELGDLSGGN
jgi:hypothetical protein